MDNDIYDWGIYGTINELRSLGLSPHNEPTEDEEINTIEGEREEQSNGYTKNDFHSDLNSEQDMQFHCNSHNDEPLTETEMLYDTHKRILSDWTCVMTLLGLKIDAADLTKEDVISKTFHTAEDAERFFTLYAKIMGFSVRKGHNRKRVTGEVCIREWLCSREGSRRESYLRRIDRVREPKNLTRVGCRVALRVAKDKRTSIWVVKEFITAHSHRLAQQGHHQFLRSNRKIRGGALQTAMAMKVSGIRTCHIILFMAKQAGRYDKVPFIPKDLYKKLNMYEYAELSDCDASRAIGYMQQKMDHDGRFFARFTYDEFNRLQNLVWADSRCQSDYSYFGHALAFDTIYRTNDYEKPLLIFIGINHHFKTTILGFALLINETYETYRWVVESFLECMGGVIPEAVVTDGDLAMQTVIAELMPHTKHRLCRWHISQNALRHVKDPAFHPRLKRMMFHRFTEEGFVKEWNALIEEFGLQDNRWARTRFRLRKLWAITFLRGHFFAGMDTTQRCEGMNYFIKTKVDPNMKLSEFVRQIDLGMSWLRNDESKLDYETTNTLPPLGGTNFPDIERQAASVFIRVMFFRVRDEMKREGKYMVRSTIKEGDIVTIKFKKYGTTNVSRSVMFNTATEEFYCECEGFPTNGIPCRHIFATMKSRNMNKIPNSLILRRWTMQANIREESRESYNPKCKYMCTVESARFGHIHNQGAEIAYYSAKNEDLFRLGNTHMEKVVNIIRTAWQGYTDDAKKKIMEAAKETEIDIRNPVFTKTKGTANCPATGRKMVRRCSICNKKGHNKTTCLRRETNTVDSPDLSLNLEDLSNNTVRLDEETDTWSEFEANTSVSTQIPNHAKRKKEHHQQFQTPMDGLGSLNDIASKKFQVTNTQQA